MRAVVLLALLAPLAARAHFFTFDFVTPSGVGVRTDGGFTAVQWVDSPDPTDLADVTMFAARNGIAPFTPGTKDVQFGPLAIPLSDPGNVVFWDARAVAPGCYQPFAQMDDRVEGRSLRPSAGLITVGPIDGGNLPPAIWVLNQDYEKPPLDGGNFALRMRVDDPDDRGEITLRWADGADGGGTLVQGLPIADGGGTLTYAFNPRGLPPAGAYYLQVEVKGFDGQRCATWWGGFLPGNAAADAGDADAGVEDAGVLDGGADGGENLTPPRGCGCGQSGSPLPLLAALVFGWLHARARVAARREQSATRAGCACSP